MVYHYYYNNNIIRTESKNERKKKLPNLSIINNRRTTREKNKNQIDLIETQTSKGRKKTRNNICVNHVNQVKNQKKSIQRERKREKMLRSFSGKTYTHKQTPI